MRILLAATILFFYSHAYSQSPVNIEKPDLEVINSIRAIGLERSKVMNHAFYLTDVAGPRLTNSPGYKRAADWVIRELKTWGIGNARLEPWGEFGKSWELEKLYVAMTAPYYKPISAYPKAWTRGTNGLQHAEIMVVTIGDSSRLASLASSMKGKLILVANVDKYAQSFEADARRYNEEDLTAMTEPRVAGADSIRRSQMTERFRARMAEVNVINSIRSTAEKAGAIAMLSTSPRNHDGTVFVQGSIRNVQHRDSADAFPDLMIGMEDYLSFCRLAQAGIPVKMDLEVKTSVRKDVIESYNVIAEIPGTDPLLKDEVVMLGAHLDSWQGSTGATDNAAGSAVMIEAMRIIKELGLKNKRTIRLALWSGEEQGLFGSRGYVRKTFGDSTNPTPAHEKFACYFNIDNGTGRIRGIYAQGNRSAAGIFSTWLEPFRDLGATTVTLQNTGSTDHIPFQNAGLPGFQFIQDPIEYSTRTHHSNMDSFDHLVADDLRQISTIVASFVYNAANLEGKFPRK